jgi:NitT/TauT family transport system substrate-binding protein
MRGDFIDKHPDLVEGWLKANLEAEQFVMDLKNQKQVVEMVEKHAVGMPKRAIWFSIYGQIPPSAGGTTPKWTFPLLVDDKVRKNISELWGFGIKEKLIATEMPFDKAIDDKIAQKLLAESGLKSPIGEVNGLPAEENPFQK